MINLYCLKLQVTLCYKVKVDKISACWDNEDQEQNWNTSNLIDKGNWPHSVRLGKSEVSKKKKKKGSSGGLVCLWIAEVTWSFSLSEANCSSRRWSNAEGWADAKLTVNAHVKPLGCLINLCMTRNAGMKFAICWPVTGRLSSSVLIKSEFCNVYEL